MKMGRITLSDFYNKLAKQCTVAVVLLIICLIPANAQYQNLLRNLKGLTEGDRELMKQTAQVDMNEKDIGTVLSWQNKESGNRGRVQLVEKLEKNGYKCRKIVHGLVLATGKKHRFQFTLCKIGAEWKISE